MNECKPLSLREVLELLRQLDDTSVGADGTSSQFLEVKRGPRDGAISVNGNRDGLVHLARLILEVAAKDFVGAHQHFDNAGELDTCEAPLTIVLKLAEWEAR
jgi:hypothetical protein